MTTTSYFMLTTSLLSYIVGIMSGLPENVTNITQLALAKSGSGSLCVCVWSETNAGPGNATCCTFFLGKLCTNQSKLFAMSTNTYEQLRCKVDSHKILTCLKVGKKMLPKCFLGQ